MKKLCIICVLVLLSLAFNIALAEGAVRYKLPKGVLTEIVNDTSIPEDIRNRLPGKLGKLVDNEYASEGKLVIALNDTLDWDQKDYIPQILNHVEVISETMEGIDMGRIMNVLMKFLIWAVVFEVTLTPLFTWRKFLELFDGKGLKIPITLGVIGLVFWNFDNFSNYDLNIFAELLEVMEPEKSLTEWGQFWGKVLTAFLIAGGSEGILRIFDKIGIRDLEAVEEKAAEAKLASEQRKLDKEKETRARQRVLDKKKLQTESA